MKKRGTSKGQWGEDGCGSSARRPRFNLMPLEEPVQTETKGLRRGPPVELRAGPVGRPAGMTVWLFSFH